ncbi:Gfo/Idh/MocA family protein [Fictibacillus fluitans]|uniref:Gfo/Idh/MocA family oxidoreductase n=1 Tax=Fictibacillus fluitans TaxID=3058422 RepID=A0ABT8HW68_9BACL|nr:Gfo/Idh/MocA family oxidoreductase [Fictibacillus sp. NE201]MDN4525029.1 Gfo/Idh/MocA family oxidoreductase [Fictibacillus sp. NE201]
MIKVAIIGTGAIASAHIKAYQQFADRCEIIALCDLYVEKAKSTVEEFHLNAHIYTKCDELLQDTDIDLISICTPPYTHAEIAVAALNAGKHVLVEKPMAASLEECDAMNDAQQKSGRVLSVISQNRFTNPMMKLKSILETGLMGPIVHTQVDSFWWRGHSYYDLWWRGTWEKEGGGCTLNHAVHHIDIFHWMNGMPSEVTAVTTNTSHDNAEVEDLSVAICSYPNGSLGQITSSVVHHGEEQQLIFQGKNARVSVPWKVRASKSKENGFPERDHELEQKIQQHYEAVTDLSYEGHAAQVDDVLCAIEGKKSVLVDGHAGRRTLELITAIYQSANTRQSASLPLNESSPFYTRKGILENARHFYEKTASVKNFSENVITTGGKYE